MSVHLKGHSGVTMDGESGIYVRVDEEEDEEVEALEEDLEEWADEGEGEGEEGYGEGEGAEGELEGEGEGEGNGKGEGEGEGEIGEESKESISSSESTPLSSSSPAPSLPSDSTKEKSRDRDEDEWKKSKVTADDLRKYLQDASQSTPVRWEIDRDEISIMQKIAEGTSGKVLRGAYRYQDVAVKILKKKMDARQAQVRVCVFVSG